MSIVAVSVRDTAIMEPSGENAELARIDRHGIDGADRVAGLASITIRPSTGSGPTMRRPRGSVPGVWLITSSTVGSVRANGPHAPPACR